MAEVTLLLGFDSLSTMNMVASLYAVKRPTTAKHSRAQASYSPHQCPVDQDLRRLPTERQDRPVSPGSGRRRYGRDRGQPVY